MQNDIPEIDSEVLEAMTANVKLLSELRNQIAASIVSDCSLTLENNYISGAGIEVVNHDRGNSSTVFYKFVMNGEDIAGKVNVPHNVSKNSAFRPSKAVLLGLFRAMANEITKTLLETYAHFESEATFSDEGSG